MSVPASGLVASQMPYLLFSLLNHSNLPFTHLQLAGKNSHHIVEATFKAFARALRHACEADPRRAGTIASSKGVLTQQ